MRKVRIKEYVIHLKNSFSDLDVLLLGDFHLHGKMKPSIFHFWREQLREKLTNLEIDLVFLLGDYSDDDNALSFLGLLLEILPKDKRVYAVLGNHDKYYYPLRDIPRYIINEKGLNRKGRDLSALKRTFKDHNIILLENRTVRYTHGDDVWNITGLDCGERCEQEDYMLRGEGPHLVLSHYPDRVSDIEPGFDLFCTGHTHGGIFGVLSGSKLFRKQPWGLHTHRDMKVVITPGIGCSRGCPRIISGYGELTVVHLRSDESKPVE